MRAITRLVVVSLAVVLLAAACGDDDSTNTSANGQTTTTVATESTTTAAGASSAAAKTLKVAHSDEYGDLLVGANGMTLYLFEKDQGTTTACTGACADNWPPLVADQPTAGDGIDQAKLSTSANGIKPNQVVYNGHLLYFFAGDSQPGDVNGTKIPSWYPVNPSGNKIDKD